MTSTPAGCTCQFSLHMEGEAPARFGVSPGGERRILIVPLHRNLAVGTLHGIHRQAARLVPSDDLRRAFFVD